jgi:hypothetical protein
VSDRLRNLALAASAAAMRAVIRLLTPVFPRSRSVVVSVFPATEGNGLEAARALVRRYPGEVVWLREGDLPADVAALADGGMTVVPKASVRGLLAYLRAEAVLFTHGLYGSPRPSPRKPVVNLWHGDGPKDIRPAKGVGEPIASTYLVGSTRLFSTFQASALGVPADRVLLTGNPRTDQLWAPVDPVGLAALGITADFVVWMPTFRRARAVGAVRRTAGPPSAVAGLDHLRPLLHGLAARGLQLVVKPHPMDADRRQGDGVVTVAEEDLVRAGVSLYGLLGRSRGLVTDYSSVWVDYLLLDRPMAFLVPDRDSYDRALFPSDVLDWAPGEVVGRSSPAFGAFLADLDAGGRYGADCRAEAASRIGLNPTRTAADDLVTALVERGVLTGDSTSLRGRRNGRSRKW